MIIWKWNDKEIKMNEIIMNNNNVIIIINE